MTQKGPDAKVLTGKIRIESDVQTRRLRMFGSCGQRKKGSSHGGGRVDLW